MIALLSPSKNLHNQPIAAHRHQLPRLHVQSEFLIDKLSKVKPKELQSLMDINDKLATLNVARYQSWSWPHASSNATAAIYTFRGEVYQGLDANTFTKKQADQADKQIRILSGLYGLLRPLDLIQPYRLEMGTALKIGKSKNLYQFWGDTITDLLNEDIAASKSKEVINLASQEYMQALTIDKLSAPVIDIQFLEERNGKLQFLSYNAKRSRGWMARYIVNHQIKRSKDLKAFTEQGYGFRDDLSNETKLVFVR